MNLSRVYCLGFWEFVARNEMVFLIIRKALNQAIGLMNVFSYIRLRRCCRLLP